jgi:hypothetical protein
VAMVETNLFSKTGLSILSRPVEMLRKTFRSLFFSQESSLGTDSKFVKPIFFCERSRHYIVNLINFISSSDPYQRYSK